MSYKPLAPSLLVYSVFLAFACFSPQARVQIRVIKRGVSCASFACNLVSLVRSTSDYSRSGAAIWCSRCSDQTHGLACAKMEDASSSSSSDDDKRRKKEKKKRKREKKKRKKARKRAKKAAKRQASSDDDDDEYEG